MNKKNQIISVYQIVRILCIAIVVLAHSSYLTITTDMGGINWIRPENTSAIYTSAFFTGWFYSTAWVYRLVAPVLFMMSGSIYALNPENNFKTLVIKKSKRLLIPYIIFGLFFMIPIKTLGGFYQIENMPAIIGQFLLGHETGHLWFLIALFWTFILFYGFKKVIKNNFLILVSTFLLYLFHTEIPVNFYEFSFCSQYVFFFTIGYLLENLRPKLENKKALNSILFLFFIVINIADTKHHFLPQFGFMIMGSFLVYSFAFLLNSFVDTSFLNKPAKKTFEIYLYHDPIMVLVLFFLMKYNALTTVSGTLFYFFTRTIGVVLLSLLIDFFVCKILKMSKQKKLN